MNAMFFGSKAFNQDISGWNVSNVASHSSFAPYSVLQTNYLPDFQ